MILLRVAVNNLLSFGRIQICWKTSAGRKKEFIGDIFGSCADGLTCQIWLVTGKPTSKVGQIMNVASC